MREEDEDASCMAPYDYARRSAYPRPRLDTRMLFVRRTATPWVTGASAGAAATQALRKIVALESVVASVVRLRLRLRQQGMLLR